MPDFFTAERQRHLHLGALGGSLLLLVLALVVFNGARDGLVRMGILVVLVALLGLEVWLMIQARRAADAAALDPSTWEAPQALAAEPAAGAEPAPAAPQKVIRCKQCSSVFPVVDTGVRPLVAACPHCGRSGVIKVRSDA